VASLLGLGWRCPRLSRATQRVSAICGKDSICISGGFLSQKGERLRNAYEALLLWFPIIVFWFALFSRWMRVYGLPVLMRCAVGDCGICVFVCRRV